MLTKQQVEAKILAAEENVSKENIDKIIESGMNVPTDWADSPTESTTGAFLGLASSSIAALALFTMF